MGIGGSGASAVARIARGYGYEVSGCDLEEGRITRLLRNEGIPVEIGHNAAHLKNIRLLAHTSAVFYQSAKEPEYLQARKRKIAVTWEEFMARYLMPEKFVVAVAGTHGKGTTTAMLAWILDQAGTDPTCEIGANLLDWNRKNFRVGKSEYFICEADEFRDKFLLYKPNLLVVTSVEMDHPEYFKNINQILGSFNKLIRRMKAPKILVINQEDGGCKELIKSVKSVKGLKIIKYQRFKNNEIKLKLPGEHIRADAAAAFAAAKALGIAPNQIKQYLESFSGLERRFEYRGKTAEGVDIYDDYAHHPTAVRVNIAAARERRIKGKLWVVFQPHMYARLQLLFADFKEALRKADRVVVTDVYTRREKEISKPTGKDLALAIGGPQATYVGGDLTNVANFIRRNTAKNDTVLLMGAGDIYQISDLLFSR